MRFVIGHPFPHLEVSVLLEVFREAGRIAQKPAYLIEIVSGLTESGDLTTQLDDDIREIGFKDVVEPADTLIVLTAKGALPNVLGSEEALWLRQQCSASRRIVAIGGGTFLLASLGVLDDRRAVSHWSVRDRFEQLFPKVSLQSDHIFTSERNLYTCAGALASIDLALKLVEDDLGSSIAAQIAGGLLLHYRRAGESSQISQTLRIQATATDPISRLITWLPDNLTSDLSVRSLARRVAMSPRNFARIFRREVGLTPAKYIKELRVEAAQHELSVNKHTVAKAAELSGFANTETLRRIFLRRLGVTPKDFRGRTASEPVPCTLATRVTAVAHGIGRSGETVTTPLLSSKVGPKGG